MVKIFTKEQKLRIVEAIRAAEKVTSGEIRVHVTARLRGEALAEAKKIFNRLGMRRTKHRNGILILVAPKQRSFAIWGDDGIHSKVGDAFWNDTRDAMAAHFTAGRFLEGVLAGVESAGRGLAEHFPYRATDRNELPNRVTGD